MKKLNLIIILLIILLGFTGCSQINYGISVNLDNSISEMMQIKLDNENLSTAGINAVDLMGEIETQMQEWLNQKIQGRTIIGFNADIQKDETNFYITLSLNYSTIEVYNQFWNVIPNNEEKKCVFHFFYDSVIISENTSIFSDIQNSSFAEYFQNWCTENYPDSANIWTDNDFQFGYVYSIPSALRYFSNADRVCLVNGMAYHIWEFDLSQTDTEICFYINIIQGRNLACWWIIFLVLTGIFGLCLFYRLRYLENKKQYF